MLYSPSTSFLNNLLASSWPPYGGPREFRPVTALSDVELDERVKALSGSGNSIDYYLEQRERDKLKNWF